MAYTAIDDPEAYFQVKTYTGTNASTSFTLDGDTDMQPDLVWLKVRSAGSGQDHTLFDSVRGVQKFLESNTNLAEATGSNYLTAFNSDGFTLGDDQSHVNASGDTYVAWCWKESATAGFDIVAYTGNATDRTISHSLSAVPKVILVKRLSGGDSQWAMYHHTLSNNNFLVLNTTGASATTDHWNDTDPTSSVFSINSTGDEVNVNTDTYIAYLWAEKQGFSKFGSYTGNGSGTDGTFVHTGFKVAWLLVKQTNASGESWFVWDNKRSSSSGSNEKDKYIYANLSNVEGSGGVDCDFLSNGFKHYYSGDASNASGATYSYMAFAEAPFVNSKGVPCNAE